VVRFLLQQKKRKSMKNDIQEKETENRIFSIRIPIKHTQLEGELTIPANARGIILFAHGSGSSRHSPRNQYVAQVIRQSGNATLLFDLLTPAEEIEDNITAALRFDVRLLAQRLVVATHWIRNHLETQRLSVGYFGSSTGGGAALVAAAELGKGIGAVVSRGGRPDLAGGALSHVQAPTLLIVGEYDEVVIRLNEDALERLGCEKELKIVPRATHLFEEKGALEEVAQLAADWFQRHLHCPSPTTNDPKGKTENKLS
jgi:pimeloyl-ACP methyl ester carboxylesterase